MSQTYDPNSPEHGPEYGQGYASGPGWAGYASAPPPPPRRNHKRGLILTGAVALAAGAATGGLIGSMHGVTASTMTAASRSPLSASQIAQRVDPALVDVVSTLGNQGASAAGTGIVLTSNGTVLTNNHVIRGATSIKVTDVGNGRTYTAKVVGYDASKDVAVIQLQNASGLTTANLGDSSSVQTGDSVTALGNAGGKGGTPSVATGTVTALNQGITASDEGSGVNSEQLTGLIETNADIQPGDRHEHRGLQRHPVPVRVQSVRRAGLRHPDRQRGDHRQADRGGPGLVHRPHRRHRLPRHRDRRQQLGQRLG